MGGTSGSRIAGDGYVAQPDRSETTLEPTDGRRGGRVTVGSRACCCVLGLGSSLRPTLADVGLCAIPLRRPRGISRCCNRSADCRGGVVVGKISSPVRMMVVAIEVARRARNTQGAKKAVVVGV